MHALSPLRPIWRVRKKRKSFRSFSLSSESATSLLLLLQTKKRVRSERELTKIVCATDTVTARGNFPGYQQKGKEKQTHWCIPQKKLRIFQRLENSDFIPPRPTMSRLLCLSLVCLVGLAEVLSAAPEVLFHDMKDHDMKDMKDTKCPCDPGQKALCPCEDGHDDHDMGDMDMDHSNHSMHMMMMYFHFGVDEVVLFKDWKISTAGGMVASVIGVFLMGMLYEGLKYFREYLFKQYVSSIQFSTVAITGEGGKVSQVHKVEKHKMLSASHGIQTTLHIVQMIVSYFLMLIFMTYNVWLCLGVVLGSGVGYFVFGWRKASVVDITEHCH